MERDVLLSHGLSQFTKECMMEKSDKYRWGVCRHCGILANYAPKRNIIECLNCGLQDISVIETPYTFKLLIQEMEAMGIQIRLSSESIEENIIEEYGEFNYPELYDYIEEVKGSPKPKSKKKTKTQAKNKKAKSESEADTEAESQAESESNTGLESNDEAFNTTLSENDSESEENESKGGQGQINKTLIDNRSDKNDTDATLDLDFDGIYGGDDDLPPTIVSSAENPINPVNSNDADTNQDLLDPIKLLTNESTSDSVANDDTDILKLNKAKELEAQVKAATDLNQTGFSAESANSSLPLSMTPAKMPGGDIKVITLNTTRRLPEPKTTGGYGNDDFEYEERGGDDDDFFTD
jgi:hypothetical protein